MIWGQIAESDEVYSPRTRKWYEITAVVTNDERVKFWAKGVPTAFTKPIGEVIPDGTVRRGKTGQAMDLFVTIFSGQTVPDPPAAYGPAPADHEVD